MRGTLLADMETFADALRGQIEAKGWTAYRLAAEAGVTRSGLSLYLSGQRIPDDDSITAIARALGADRDSLLGLADAQRIGAERLGRIARVVPLGDAAPPLRLPYDAAAFDQLRELTVEGHAIPYYGRVGCGEFLELCEVAVGTRNVPARPGVLTGFEGWSTSSAPTILLLRGPGVSPIGDTKAPPADLAGGVFDPARPAWHDLDRHAIRRPSGDARG